jgi:hypothetical protein
MKVNVVMVLPLPIGRRVAVRWYRRTSKGLIYGQDVETRPNEPLIEDLETGVVYAFDWLFDATSGADSNRDPLTFSDGFASGVEEERAVVGRITACRVFTIIVGGSRERTQQTELTLEPETEKSAYR